MAKNLDIVSVRLNPDDIAEIDRWCSDVGLYKRSEVIQAAVRLALVMIRLGLIRKALKFYPMYGDVVDKLEFEYHRDIK